MSRANIVPATRRPQTTTIPPRDPCTGERCDVAEGQHSCTQKPRPHRATSCPQFHHVSQRAPQPKCKHCTRLALCHRDTWSLWHNRGSQQDTHSTRVLVTTRGLWMAPKHTTSAPHAVSETTSSHNLRCQRNARVRESLRCPKEKLNKCTTTGASTTSPKNCYEEFLRSSAQFAPGLLELVAACSRGRQPPGRPRCPVFV